MYDCKRLILLNIRHAKIKFIEVKFIIIDKGKSKYRQIIIFKKRLTQTVQAYFILPNIINTWKEKTRINIRQTYVAHGF